MAIVIQLRDCAFDVEHIPPRPGQPAARVIRFADAGGIQVVVPLIGDAAITRFEAKWRGVPTAARGPATTEPAGGAGTIDTRRSGPLGAVPDEPEG